VRLLGHFPAYDYKSIWHRTADVDLSRITVLFGANGSGKTNLLEAIALAFEDAVSDDWIIAPPRPAPGGYGEYLVRRFSPAFVAMIN